MGIETFIIEAFSDSASEFAVWADHWSCDLCGKWTTPNEGFDAHCPLHNPMRCTGSRNDAHGMFPMRPSGDVFLLHIGEYDEAGKTKRTIIGRVPTRPLVRY